MSVLYDLNNEIVDIINNSETVEIDGKKEIVNTETGEILTDVLAKKQMKMDEILCFIGKEIKNLNAEEKALEDEKASFEERIKSKKAQIEHLKGVIEFFSYGKNVEDKDVLIKWRKRPSVVKVTDAEKIPEEFRKDLGWKPMLSEIKKAIKDGQEVSGATLEEQKMGVVIK